ncbi:N-acetylglucosamine-6-phosphate deacetylase [Bailinhaonella thermotolerans]|uniref:N-acetylglucosamine-6-phosphate deacetylase n=1 Tax=Bailinhaonella thermotolerans TaxID=1070861 RepID=UPI001F5B60D4|nr:N-acetylglucosamine-6-phosphate deacetylase [Bailinhaonella thermotolerans]
MIIAGARVVTPGGVLEPGWVSVSGGLIEAVGEGRPPRPADRDLGGAWLVPGFVDLHTHGGGGFSMGDSREDMAAAVAFHRRHGTTRTLVGLVTGPVERLAEAAGWIADLTAAGATPDGHVVGGYLEGPFLAAARCGAQDPRYLLAPDPGVLRRLLDAGRGTIRMMTVAPELPGAGELIGELRARGVIPALGHSDADYAAMSAGFAAGGRVLTHAFNGMRGLHHREPGPVIAGADAPDAVLEVICDGLHLDFPVVRALTRLAPGRIALITDAMAAAGMGDGEYTLGPQRVRVTGGRAVLADGDSLAGSTLTMGDAVKRAVLGAGLPITEASAYASDVPARLLGLPCGRIEPGLAAEFAVLDDGLDVVEVLA